MFGKLLKYELRAVFKKLGVLWIAATVILVINAVTLGLTGDPYENDSGTAVFVLSMILQYITCVAIVIMSFVYIITRFYKGLLKDEGYLMFTLPVTAGQLIGSKLVAAVIVQLIAMVSAVLPFVAFAFTGNEFFTVMKDAFAELFAQISVAPITGVLAAVMVVLMMLSLLESLLRIYMSISIGHLARKHRVLCSVGTYIGIDYALNILSTVTQLCSAYSSTTVDVTVPEQMQTALGVQTAMCIILGVVAIIVAAMCAGEFLIIRRILTKKLNLD